VYLTGGAALGGYYLGHRRSYDLDLFSAERERLTEAAARLAALCAARHFQLSEEARVSFDLRFPAARFAAARFAQVARVCQASSVCRTLRARSTAEKGFSMRWVPRSSTPCCTMTLSV
jgi:hypothetical protein